MAGIIFEVRSGSAAGTVVDTITTGEDGVATTKPLPIRDANGLINYYIVETNVSEDYTVVYPQDGDAEDNAWGPINLSFAETTDKTSTPVVNRKHETSLTVKKTDQSGKVIAGATFTVQNADDEYAVVSNGAVTWQTEKETLSTNESGQIVLSGIPNGTYTVTEDSVPDAYLSTGSVSDADEGTASTRGALSGKVTLDTLESKTITFKNDQKPVLQFTKNVSGTVSGNFTFELYEANADGTAPTGNSLGSATVAAGGTASFTVDTAGKYFLKETAWPAGVIAPSLTASEGTYTDADGDVYYGPYELKNNETTKATIANTPNTGSLAIDKTDAKTKSALAGATFTVSVDASGWSDEMIALLPNGFKKGEGNTYAMTTSATGTNGKVTVSGLPLYNGTTAISYTVTEAAAPANYIKSAQTQTATPATAANYAASCAFTNAPMAKVVVTKTYFKQWEADSKNRIDYALEGAEIAIFEEANGVLAQVGATQTTGADGTVTFEGLDGTKTYYVFELSNTKNLGAEGGKSLAGDVNNIIGQSASAATNAYYSATLNLAEEDDNQAEAKLSNVETYVQLTLEKFYYPEDEDGVDISQEKTLLDRAKFHLYRCTLDEYEKAGRSIQELVDSEDGMAAYRVSDYVYESGVSNNAGPGMVVTGSLEGGYVYWFNEFEAPAGFVTPEWPASLSVAFVPDAAQGNEISYEGKTSAAGSMENDPEQGPGTIRYLQVMVDKVARPKDAADGSKDEPLANTTFELWLTDSTYTERVERVAKFTTGVDVPEGEDYLPGRGVSESIQMHKLYDEYGGEANGNYVTRVAGELEGTVQHYEYAAHFVLVETQWPANTTPVSYTYQLYIETNGANDADQDTLATLNDLYTGENAIVNTLEQQVTVAIQKVGYAANASATTWPLAGAEITIYSDEARTKALATGTTGADGLVYFTLDPLTTYYWAETKVPNGYEAVAPQDGYSFRTPGYSSEGATEIEPIVTVKNVQYRKVSLAKKDGDAFVAATFELQQNGTAVKVWQKDAATGAFTAAGTSVTTTTEGPAEFYLPAGTYTVVETKVGDRALFPAEKSNFALINGNKVTVTFEEDEAVKEPLTFVNPGTGSLTLTKKDDAGTVMPGVQFTLSFKAFAAADVASTTLPAASAVTDDVAAQTGVTVSQQQLTTDAEGKIHLENLVPGWYKLTELEGDNNENHVLADPVVIKVTASNFGTAIDGASATVTNNRKGYLNVEKAYEGGFADGFSAASSKVDFGVYTNANCTGEAVATFSITGESAATPVALDPGTYYVKETTSGAWYTHYTVDYTAEVEGRGDVAKTWLPEAGGAVQVTVASADTAENPVMVSFTNVGYLADLAFDKVGVQGETRTPLADAQFVLYYGSGDAALYYDGNDKWGAQAQAAKYISDVNGRVTIADIQLPHAVVSTSTDMSGTYSIKEVVTPEAYTAPETDAQVALKPGDNTNLTGDSAIVNERGVVITITKYNKPYAVTEGRGTLDGAEFTLYHMSESGSVKETFPAQTTKNGQVQFVNLPQLKDGEYYAIQETAIPDGYVEDSLEVYNGATPIAADANGYYKVATDVDVNINAYNTPYGKIAILKYDYVDHSKLPVGGLFTATNDADAQIHYSATLRTAQSGDESLLAGGYQLSGNHYVKDGISYSVAYMNDVEPGTYTVVEEESPDGYLYTPDSTADDPWHTTQSVTVPEDGSTAVVVFANLPNPTSLSVNIEKAGEYKGEGDLLGEEYQAIEFTLSDFTQGTELPLEDATITDETITFLDAAGNEVANVDWYVASVTIGAARYEPTALYDTPSTATISATVNGSRMVSLASARTITFGAGECKAVEIDYHNGSAATEGLDAGFKADPIVITIMARQAGGTETVPVAKVSNKASVSMTYNFGVVGAESDSETRTKTDDATASVEIAEAPELPKASLAKTSKVKDENGNEVTGETAVVGQTIEYTITLTGQSEPGMQDPILADILPAGLNVVEVTAEAATLTDVTAQYAGQNVWATAKGELGQGETFTLTIEAEVMPAALAGLNGEGNQITNTAYAFNNVTVPQSTQNEHGSSFTDAAGNLPGVSVPEAFAGISTGSGMALSDEAHNNLTSASGVRINKLIKLENGTAWAGAEALLVAKAGETVTYRVEVTNNGGTTVTNLRILDVLPYKGDGRGSAWGPTLSGSVSGAADIRYSTERPAETAATFKTGFAGWSESAADANAFVAIVPELGAGETVTLTYSAVVPANPAAKDYYQLAINRAYCVYDNGPSTPLSSADTKVTITPPSVALGDRVWVDENANGIQDATETKVPGGNTTFRLVSYMEGVPVSIATDDADANGIYGFANLTPAAPQDSAARYFSDSGDVDYTSLMGSARATYQLSVTVPDGYRITTPSKTTVEARSNSDSDFALTGETTKFYIPAGTDDLTHDVGLIRERDLTIAKKGTNNLNVAGATFAIYGPYYEVPSAISADKLVATIITGQDGRAVFNSNAERYLNAYAYYVVVETSAPDNYSATNLTASGNVESATVTGEGIADGNYFVLAPFAGKDMTGAVSETVSVTNTYSATGQLTITGNKTFVGQALAANQFSFELSSTDDADFAKQTVSNDADGNFAFPAIEYTYADVQFLASKDDHAYHYTVKEVTPEKDEDGIAYDRKVYTITVKLSDDDGDGQITVSVTVSDGTTLSSNDKGTASVNFTNAAQGGLTLQKIVVGDDESTPKSFRFTLTLKDADGEPLTGKPFKQNNQAIDFVEESAGVYVFHLKNLEEVTLTGLPVGATYIVAEDSYAQAGFTTTVTGDTTGTITWDEEPRVEFTNTRYLGGLTVEKETDGNGAETEDTFNFTVTLEHDTLPLNNYYGVQFTNVALEEGETGYKATATFILKGGETKALTGIPAGTKYTVTEQDYTAEGYVTDILTNNATGEITHGGNPTVTFKNTRKVGGLTVSKTVDGNDFDANKAFDITVTLTAPANVNLVGSYAGAQSGSISVAATQTGATWTETFSLKNGQSINFTGLPENTAYTVSEADYAADGYVKTVSGAEEGSIKAEATATVAYTNTRDIGDLVITKTVTGSGREEDKLFDFTVTLKNATVDLNKTFGDVTFSPVTEGDTHEVQATFALKHGESKNITGIPVGTTYTVTEADYTADGYTVTKTGDTGTIAVEEGTATRPTFTAAFTNNRDVGNLQLTKLVTGSAFELGTPNAPYSYMIAFELTPPAGMSLEDSYYAMQGSSGTTYLLERYETLYTWDGTVYISQLGIAPDETYTIYDLPAGTTYKVYELYKDTDKGETYPTYYDDLGFEEPVFTSGGITATGSISGTIPGTEGANTVAVTVTNERNAGSLSVEKIVEGTGAQPEKVFTFTLQLTHIDGVTLKGKYPATINGTDTTVAVDATGKATFKLTGGQTITIKGIPDGTTYAVTEDNYTADGYTVKETGEKGNITNGTTAEATFTNTRNVGGLTVTKKTVGNGLDEPGVRKEFDITVTLEAPTGVDLVGTVNGVALSADGTVTEGVWSKTFTLKANESVTFTGLPEGTTYTVSEEDYTAQGFVTTITPQTGSIEVEDGATEAPTVDVTVTNTRNVGGLTIAKAVTGSGSSVSDTFTFRLKLENETVNVDGTYNITYSGEANQPTTLVVSGGTAQITLHGGQTAFIDGIPLGTTYTVTELASDGANAVQDVTDANGYTLTTENNVSDTITSTEGAYQASFTNDRKVGDLTVIKAEKGNGFEDDYPNTQDSYDITVTLTPPTGVTLVGSVNGVALPADGTVANGVWSKTFQLKHDESIAFTDLPAGTTYAISEADYTNLGYEEAVLESTGTTTLGKTDDGLKYITGTIPGEEGANSVAATVTNERNTGSLSVEKIVEGTGAETEKEFAFTLQLTNAGVTLEGAYPADINGTDTTVAVDASGKATFKLKGGETITINGIPDGTTYEVLEQDYSANGYETTSTLDSGEIIDGETAQAKFTNHRDVGSLKITKEVAGNGEDAPNALTEFEVTVELTPPQGVTLVGTWEQGEESGNVAASNAFTLTDGESVELTGLPTGTSYTITEADYAANGYITDIDTASGEITDGALRATVLNTMNVGDLSVLKTVNGSGAETDREFSFTLTLINEAGVTVDNTYETSEGTLTVTGGKATFTLKGGESLSIYGIPEGTDYTVAETDPAQYGYLITSTSGEEGTIGTGTSEATFTNTRDVGELTIAKTVTGALGDMAKAFAFALKLTPSGNGIGVDGTYDATLYTGETSGETSQEPTTIAVENGTAEFTLKHDQRLVIHEIPAGATYAVSEESYALEGYQTSASSETGTIPATGSMPVATFTNTRNGGSLRIVKNFAGNAAIPGDTFAFTIRLGRLDGVNVDGTYNALRNGVAEPITFTGGVATVWLGSGDTFEILGILSGTDYAVSEDIPVDSGYIGQGENETGTIPIDTAAQVTFTNARYTGNLTVRKTVAGNAAETDRSFRFTIFLRNPDGSNANGTYPMTGRSAFITFVNGYASIRLAAGETATIHGILSGAYYSVSEDDANTDGYVTTASGVAGIIPAIASAQASFLNTRDVGTEETTTSRTVYKVWNDSDNADGLRPTEVVVYLLADGVSIDAATLSEANGWSARFDNLPVYNADGSAIEYQVVEAYTAEYYVRYQYAAAVINITNSHNPEDFVPDEPRDPNLLTLIEDYMVPLGGNVNMNEGDCFN